MTLSKLDWNRWQELLDIIAERSLTTDEQLEYDAFIPTVQQGDDEELMHSRIAMNALNERHNRVLESIQKLTDALARARTR